MPLDVTGGEGPHAGRPIRRAGAPLERARGALVLVHGRGGDAADMLGLAGHLGAENLAVLAPEAAGNTWYPRRFVEPTSLNQPWLGSALSVLAALVADLDAAGIPSERVAIGGFSQGACLALDFAARHPRRYGALIGLSGGLIGPPGTVWPDAGSLAGTPVFLGCSDVDPHIPLARVHETDQVLSARGAAVETRIYPGFGHGINTDEIAAVKALLDGLAA